MLRMRNTTTDAENWLMGDYAAARGIRRYPYSLDFAVNPSTYGFLKKGGYDEVHSSGEVWAQIAFDVFWALTNKLGWEDDWFSVPADGEYPTAGNKLALRLLIDGMKFQPCSPSFVDSRDAILLADRVAGGHNQCELWNAFAKRGLGTKAKKGGIENFMVPAECE